MAEETRVTAALPNLDVDMRFSQDLDGGSETVTISLRATPGFEAAAGMLANPALGLALLQSNPMMSPWTAPWTAWTRMATLAWRPWIEAARPFMPGIEPPRKP
jgi:hypothetical protein